MDMICLLGAIGIIVAIVVFVGEFANTEPSGKHKTSCPVCNGVMIIDGNRCQCYNNKCIIGRQGWIPTDELYKYH